jgi:hypothetical protein
VRIPLPSTDIHRRDRPSARWSVPGWQTASSTTRRCVDPSSLVAICGQSPGRPASCTLGRGTRTPYIEGRELAARQPGWWFPTSHVPFRRRSRRVSAVKKFLTGGRNLYACRTVGALQRR